MGRCDHASNSKVCPYAIRAQSAGQVDGLSVASNKTLTVNNSLSFGGTDGTSFTLPSASAILVGTNSTQALTNKTYNGLTINSTTGTLIVVNGKTFTISNSLSFTGTDGSTVNLGAGGTVCYTADTCVQNNALNFDRFSDSLSLDASTTIACLLYTSPSPRDR